MTTRTFDDEQLITFANGVCENHLFYWDLSENRLYECSQWNIFARLLYFLCGCIQRIALAEVIHKLSTLTTNTGCLKDRVFTILSRLEGVPESIKQRFAPSQPQVAVASAPIPIPSCTPFRQALVKFQTWFNGNPNQNDLSGQIEALFKHYTPTEDVKGTLRGKEFKNSKQLPFVFSQACQSYFRVDQGWTDAYKLLVTKLNPPKSDTPSSKIL